jgi:hypothetical protein
MTIYTIEDAYLLWEIIAITAHNEWLVHEYHKNNKDRK